ncbi:hypothetical protein [Xylophilus sp. Leaf220]|uniref:hypothetical protein n=1 Tax=Xylophilus sp. Leaf220 TaxID=1735686 RepID=UPI0006F70EB7|nr:hypothetical protein [Xylophilus sp. Leaf220]KQM79972.1 hypothetical protein ASE76_01950 [Xylophilus sp. Leaf220]
MQAQKTGSADRYTYRGLNNAAAERAGLALAAHLERLGTARCVAALQVAHRDAEAGTPRHHALRVLIGVLHELGVETLQAQMEQWRSARQAMESARAELQGLQQSFDADFARWSATAAQIRRTREQALALLDSLLPTAQRRESPSVRPLSKALARLPGNELQAALASADDAFLQPAQDALLADLVDVGLALEVREHACAAEGLGIETELALGAAGYDIQDAIHQFKPLAEAAAALMERRKHLTAAIARAARLQAACQQASVPALLMRLPYLWFPAFEFGQADQVLSALQPGEGGASTECPTDRGAAGPVGSEG